MRESSALTRLSRRPARPVVSSHQSDSTMVANGLPLQIFANFSSTEPILLLEFFYFFVSHSLFFMSPLPCDLGGLHLPLGVVTKALGLTPTWPTPTSWPSKFPHLPHVAAAFIGQRPHQNLLFLGRCAAPSVLPHQISQQTQSENPNLAKGAIFLRPAGGGLRRSFGTKAIFPIGRWRFVVGLERCLGLMDPKPYFSAYPNVHGSPTAASFVPIEHLPFRTGFFFFFFRFRTLLSDFVEFHLHTDCSITLGQKRSSISAPPLAF